MDLERFQGFALGSMLRFAALFIAAVIVLKLHLSAYLGFGILIAVYIAVSVVQIVVRRRSR